MASRLAPITTVLGSMREKRIVSEAHLRFVRTLPCLASGKEIGVIAHHVRIGLFQGGRKPGDDMAVPLHAWLHEGTPDSLHSMSEGRFWNELGIDVTHIARVLYDHTGDRQRCIAEIEAARVSGGIRKQFGIRMYAEKFA